MWNGAIKQVTFHIHANLSLHHSAKLSPCDWTRIFPREPEIASIFRNANMKKARDIWCKIVSCSRKKCWKTIFLTIDFSPASSSLESSRCWIFYDLLAPGSYREQILRAFVAHTHWIRRHTHTHTYIYEHASSIKTKSKISRVWTNNIARACTLNCAKL